MKKFVAVLAVAAVCTVSSSAFAGKRHYAPAPGYGYGPQQGYAQTCAPACAQPVCQPANPCGQCQTCLPNPLGIVGGVVSGVGSVISGIGQGISGLFGCDVCF
jgi:hypothetical protein